MTPSRDGFSIGRVALLALVVGAGCGNEDARWERGDTAALTRRATPDTDLRPEGYRFAGSGTHVEVCTGNRKCPTMWAELPAPNTCGGTLAVPEAYIVHQRGVHWDGLEGEEELHGNEYRVAEKTQYELSVQHNQSVIVQCCGASSGVGLAFAIKTCPDPCGASSCPSTYGPQPFGGCKASGGDLTPFCDIQVVEAGWMDPHAPHDLDGPSGEDKRVFNVYYSMSWGCNNDGVCSLNEDCATCPDDCAEDCATP